MDDIIILHTLCETHVLNAAKVYTKQHDASNSSSRKICKLHKELSQKL